MSKNEWKRGEKQENAYINIGGGIRFLSAEYFLRELAPMGMSMRGFRALCKAIGVPMIRMGRTWLVELFAFQQGMKAISRPGQPDFLAPGCDLKASANKPENHQVELDPEYYEKHREEITKELLQARTLAGLPTPEDTEKGAKAAAQRLMHHKVAEEKRKVPPANTAAEDMALFGEKDG